MTPTRASSSSGASTRASSSSGASTRAASTTRRRLDADPRIVERRQQVERDRRRRRHRLLAGALAVASAAAGAWLLINSQLLDVDAVAVEGTSRTSADELVVLSGVSVGDRLVGMDTGAVVTALQRDPWVASATVQRVWLDGRVVMRVVERVPVAAVATATGEMALVDATGQVLAVAADPGGLPVVTGVLPGAPGQRLEQVDRTVVTAASALPPGLASRIQAVTPGASGNVEFELTDGAVVRLGGVADLDVKIRTIQTVLATVDMSCVTVIDVQSADTAVLTRGETCA
jgi:cell division protein FtsQ